MMNLTLAMNPFGIQSIHRLLNTNNSLLEQLSFCLNKNTIFDVWENE